MKKTLRIIGITLLAILVLLIAAPFLFESQIKDYVQKTVNQQVNAEVAFSDIDLNFFRKFPQATVIIEEFQVINNAPFKGDTLVSGEELMFSMSLKELFKSNDQPKKLDELKLNRAYLNIQVDSLGNANYDIAVEDTTSVKTDSSAGFSFDLKHYEINESRLVYRDLGQNLLLDIEDLNHRGTGDFSLNQSNLDTESQALVSFTYDDLNYLKRHRLALDAIIQMDLEKMRYTFLENEATINQLPLTFEGFVQVNEENNEIDLSFSTPNSEFRNFLAIIPETYAKNIEDVETSGEFTVTGRIQGIVDESQIPEIDVRVSSNNARFKYPDLPKSVEDINLDLRILNETGLADDTYLTFDNVTFRIDQDRFRTNGSIKNLTGNMLVDMALKGTINLAHLEQAYPLELEQDLSGILSLDLVTSFDMESIEAEQYQNVQSNGVASIRDFRYSSPEIPNPVQIARATMNFLKGDVKVPELEITTGKTDIRATGLIQNLMGYLFTDQQLKGNFQVNSNTFMISDFMVAEKKEGQQQTTEKEPAIPQRSAPGKAVKIPSFLDTEVAFRVGTVVYDNLQLKNARGTIILRNETASLEGVTTEIFDGSIILNGNVSTKAAVPTFAMDLRLNALNIAQSFNGLDLLQALAPVARALEGTLQTDLQLRGNLNEDLTPHLATLTGNALAEILTAEIDPDKLPLLSRLDQQLNFIDLEDLNLNQLRTRISFDDGRVAIEPFEFSLKGIKAQVHGSHGFDMSMDYRLDLDIPANMLGSQIDNSLSSLSGEELREITVKLPVAVEGSFQNPQIKMDMNQAVSQLSQQIIQKQKSNLQQRGEQAVRDILSGRTRGQTKQDTTNGKDTSSNQVPATRDTTTATQNQQAKEAARNILGGLLKGRTQKKDTTKNDDQ